jgi:hypothetical protein
MRTVSVPDCFSSAISRASRKSSTHLKRRGHPLATADRWWANLPVQLPPELSLRM